MKFGIMQPYFFPYLGHFALIAAVDQWIVFDISQYTPRSWMNRNRILHPVAGWQYITVPLANSSTSILTHEARVLDHARAGTSILGKLSAYQGKAPYYRSVVRLVKEVFAESADDSSLVHLNVAGLKAVCAYLDIPFSHRIASRLALDLPSGLGAGEWAPRICARLGASAYINPEGGRALFDPEDFRAAGIHLSFLASRSFAYAQGGRTPETDLSILDVLMWNAPDVVRRALAAHATLYPASDPRIPAVSTGSPSSERSADSVC